MKLTVKPTVSKEPNYHMRLAIDVRFVVLIGAQGQTMAMICYVMTMILTKDTLTSKESTNMKFVSHFKRICMYGEEGRLLIFFNRIYVFHSYQRFRWLLEITDS